MSRPVLLIDDDASLRRLLSLVLQRAGIESDAASDAPEAIAKLARTRYAVVLLDLQLGATSGYDVLQWMRAHDHPASVIVTTGQEDGSDLDSPNIRTVVKKPYDVAAVTSALAEFLPARVPA